jgi:hypothetical protein
MGFTWYMRQLDGASECGNERQWFHELSEGTLMVNENRSKRGSEFACKWLQKEALNVCADGCMTFQKAMV